MAEEPRVEPAPLVTPPAPEPTPTVVVAAPTPEPVRQDWRDNRIAELTAKLKTEREKGAELETRLAAPKADPAVVAPSGPTEAEIAERVRTEAARLNSTENFNRQCDSLVASGRQQYPDFDANLRSVQSLVIQGDNASVQSYWNLVRSAIQTGQGHELIQRLGQDKNEAARLMGLDDVSRAIELTKMSMDGKVTEVSGAPKPITPVGGRGAPHTAIDPGDKDRSDNLTTSEWMRRREAQVQGEGARR